MDEKLILRAAVRYRCWLLSQIQSPVQSVETSILNSLHRVSDRAAQMEMWAKRFFGGSSQRVQLCPTLRKNVLWEWEDDPHMGIVCPSAYRKIATKMVPELGEDIVTNIKQSVATLKSLATQEVVTVISPKDAVNEIRAITDAWERVKFRGNVLSVLIKDVTLSDDCEEVDLGSFWIHLNVTNPLRGLSIESIDCVMSPAGYPHPHVSGTKLCIGAGALPSQEALCQGRLEDYFRIIEAVLRTYNPGSPHNELKEWYDPDRENQFFCERCEEFRDNDSSCWCGMCETSYCDYCASGGCCLECDDWRCDECCTYCHGCEETLCNSCSVGCSECHHSFCSSCLSGCAVCEEQHCDSCKLACAYCGDSVCESCTATCGCCNDNCCDACMDETCHQCTNDICKGCQTACEDCNKIICGQCYDNSCEHCGTQMCSSCEREHNCLLQEVTSG